MEKKPGNKNLMQIAILILSVVALVGSYFYVGGGSPLDFGPSGGSGSNISGNAEFPGTIRTYDPILVIPLNTSSSTVEEVRTRDDVKNVRSDPQGYVIDTETRDDVYPIASFLRSKNVSALGIANIAVTSAIQVETITGKVNATVPGGIVRILMEPILDSGAEVRVSMVAVVRNNVLIDYNSAGLALNQVSLLMDATVASLEGKTYTYVIPWESRNSINLSGFENHSYRKIDSIVFNTPLGIDKVLEKRQFPYITYIDSGSAQVLPSFDNASQVAVNFQDVGYRLPPSVLTIDSVTDPALGFNSSVSYAYSVLLVDPRIDPSMSALIIETPSELGLNETIKLNVTALEMGGKLISLRRVSLPS